MHASLARMRREERLKRGGQIEPPVSRPPFKLSLVGTGFAGLAKEREREGKARVSQNGAASNANLQSVENWPSIIPTVCSSSLAYAFVL